MSSMFSDERLGHQIQCQVQRACVRQQRRDVLEADSLLREIDHRAQAVAQVLDGVLGGELFVVELGALH